MPYLAGDEFVLDREGVHNTPAPMVLRKNKQNQEILRLRAEERWSYTEIADHLGISTYLVSQAIKEEIAEHTRVASETAEEVLALELQNYDMMQKALHERVKDGSVIAILASLKVAESRRKLLGMDEPSRHHLEVTPPREYIGVNMDDV